jgi:hypothetical protein
MRRLILLALPLTAAVLLVPTIAAAYSATHTYMLEMGEPNLGVAANGDQIAVTLTGEAEFSVNPNSTTAAGEFTHMHADGSPDVHGTWTATRLINYQSYGCGEVFGDPIPPDLCGGAVKMSVTLTPAGTTLRLPGTMTVFCVIGTHAPQSILGPLTEGVTLNVPGVIDFNHSTGGDNEYVQTS